MRLSRPLLALLAVPVVSSAQRRPRDPLFEPSVVVAGDTWFCASASVGRARFSPCFRNEELCEDWAQGRRDRGDVVQACHRARVAHCITFYSEDLGETDFVCQRDAATCASVRRARFEMNRRADRFPALYGRDATRNISACNAVGPTGSPAPASPPPEQPPPPAGPTVIPPDGITRDDVVAALTRAEQLAATAHCLPSGTHQLRFTYAQRGTPERVARLGDALTEEEGACLLRAAQAAPLPAFRASTYSLIYPFTAR